MFLKRYTSTSDKTADIRSIRAKENTLIEIVNICLKKVFVYSSLLSSISSCQNVDNFLRKLFLSDLMLITHAATTQCLYRCIEDHEIIESEYVNGRV